MCCLFQWLRSQIDEIKFTITDTVSDSDDELKGGKAKKRVEVEHVRYHILLSQLKVLVMCVCVCVCFNRISTDIEKGYVQSADTALAYNNNAE